MPEDRHTEAPRSAEQKGQVLSIPVEIGASVDVQSGIGKGPCRRSQRSGNYSSVRVI
jgi:hypothetical protein